MWVDGSRRVGVGGCGVWGEDAEEEGRGSVVMVEGGGRKNLEMGWSG